MTPAADTQSDLPIDPTIQPASALGPEILNITAHRPWPLPSLPWVMIQHWHDLLFAHWALPAEQLRSLVPPELELDIFDAKAWLGIIPFWMSNVRLRGVPQIPTAGTFPELNVRTYVRAPQTRDKPGVYFFSLDAGSFLAVIGARAGAGLPYFWSNMRIEGAADRFHYRSRRRSARNPAEFAAEYRPVGSIASSKSDLERFVTERYCLYTVRRKRVHRIQIHHLPWPLQPADAAFAGNSMAQTLGIRLPEEKPLLHFAKFLEVYIFPPEEIG